MNKGLIICGVLGHSRRVDKCMGRISCARCGEELIDTFTQAIDPEWEKTLTYVAGMSTKEEDVWYHKRMAELLKAKATA